MKKEDKVNVIASVTELVKEYGHFYLVDVTGMNSEATSALRRKCFGADVKMVLVKNTMMHKALQALGSEYEPLFACLKGTTAVMFSKVANAPAKLLKEVQNKDGFPGLKGAWAEEGAYVGADQLAALAAIKSKNEVIADIVALLQSPIKNVVSSLQSGANTIHGVLKTLGERPE